MSASTSRSTASLTLGSLARLFPNDATRMLRRQRRAPRVDRVHAETRVAQHRADGFRAIWQRAMRKHVESGWERFTEHDLRAKVASDSESLDLAQARMGHQTPNTTSRVYRRGPLEVAVLSRVVDE